MPSANTTWSPGRKISFRFFFLFLGMALYSCVDATAYILHDALYHTQLDIGVMYRPLRGIFFWMDKHIFHLGYNPAKQQSWPGDNHFGVLFYLTLFSLAVVGTVIWTGLDRKRTNYARLSYWFRLCLRYALGIVVFGYGIDKLIPVQMRYPNVFMMITPFGYFDRFAVLWNSMGAAPGYMIFTGATEVLAALLLFSRRTAVAGYVLTAAVLSNVFAINVFYNITVKLFSGQLLVMTFFLLAPYLKTLFGFFFRGNAGAMAQPGYVFHTEWKRYVLTGALIVVPLAILIVNTTEVLNRYAANLKIYRRERIYDVTTFMAKDTLPPLTTDTLRWKRFLLFNSWRVDYAAIMSMNDEPDWYQYKQDTVKKTITLYYDPDTANWRVLHYSNPSNGEMQLTGKWRGQDIRVSLKEFPADSMIINKEKIALIRD